MASETGANTNWIHPANTFGAAANLREVGASATYIKGEVILSDFPGTPRTGIETNGRHDSHVGS
jgi:hypothetical protein